MTNQALITGLKGQDSAYPDNGMHACNGMLFNHASPLRGEAVVTRQITRAVTCVALGLHDGLYVGNLCVNMAGHRGSVGPTLVEAFQCECYENLVFRAHAELHLSDRQATEASFAAVVICTSYEPSQGNPRSVPVWSTGTPRRDDMAEACMFATSLPDEKHATLLASDETKTGTFTPSVLKIGVGTDLNIKDFSEMAQLVVSCTGTMLCDATKPNGAPRRLTDGSRHAATKWQPRTYFADGLAPAYQDFRSNS